MLAAASEACRRFDSPASNSPATSRAPISTIRCVHARLSADNSAPKPSALSTAARMSARWSRAETTAARVATEGMSVGLPVRISPKNSDAPHTRTKSRNTSFESTTDRSEEHTSELQSRQYLVCRLLLEKKKKKNRIYTLLN